MYINNIPIISIEKDFTNPSHTHTITHTIAHTFTDPPPVAVTTDCPFGVKAQLLMTPEASWELLES